MVSNHLILPVAEHYPALSRIRGYLLPARRIVALLVIGSAYLFIAGLKGSFLLVGIGTLAIYSPAANRASDVWRTVLATG